MRAMSIVYCHNKSPAADMCRKTSPTMMYGTPQDDSSSGSSYSSMTSTTSATSSSTKGISTTANSGNDDNDGAAFNTSVHCKRAFDSNDSNDNIKDSNKDNDVTSWSPMAGSINVRHHHHQHQHHQHNNDKHNAIPIDSIVSDDDDASLQSSCHDTKRQKIVRFEGPGAPSPKFVGMTRHRINGEVLWINDDRRAILTDEERSSMWWKDDLKQHAKAIACVYRREHTTSNSNSNNPNISHYIKEYQTVLSHYQNNQPQTYSARNNATLFSQARGLESYIFAPHEQRKKIIRSVLRVQQQPLPNKERLLSKASKSFSLPSRRMARYMGICDQAVVTNILLQERQS